MGAALAAGSGLFWPRGDGSGEIEMIVIAAGGVERCVARGAAGVALEVGGDREDGVAGTAEDGEFLPFGLGPGLDGMVGEGVVAVFAGVEEAAAFHFDGDDVEGGVVVEAAGLRIEMEAVDFWRGHGMGEEGE